MLHRSFVIMICISLVGVTALPGSLIPCCCKTGGNMMNIQKSLPGCCAHKALPACCRAMAGPASCCSKAASQPQAFCSEDTLTKSCPYCRCLQQMQVVALSGYAVHDGTVTWASVPMTETAAAPSVAPQTLVASFLERDPPGISTLLQTCTLRI